MRSGIVFVFRSCRQGCGLQNKSLARINFAIITKGIAKTIVTPNCFVMFLAGMVPGEGGDHFVVRWNLRPVIFLVAPYCAIPRDYLSDTPLLRAPPFLSVSPLESMRSGGAIPPPQKGYLGDTGAIPYKNKPNGCDTPLCDTISKGYCAIWGGISHWAAKVIFGVEMRDSKKISEEKRFFTESLGGI